MKTKPRITYEQSAAARHAHLLAHGLARHSVYVPYNRATIRLDGFKPVCCHKGPPNRLKADQIKNWLILTSTKYISTNLDLNKLVTCWLAVKA